MTREEVFNHLERLVSAPGGPSRVMAVGPRTALVRKPNGFSDWVPFDQLEALTHDYEQGES